MKNETEDKEVKLKTFEQQLEEDWAPMLEYFRMSPDKFLDFITPEDSTFRLYPFQRLYLRIMARYRITYLVATRGTSKSFLNILFDYIKCILYPNIKLAMLAPQKGQASAIAQQNIDAIWHFLPILKNEVKKATYQKDYTKLEFWNGSILDIVPVSEGSRGLRKNGLSFEEIVNMEKHRESIGSVILPLLANNRKGANGIVSDKEIHKQIKYITTASNRQSYAWETLQMVLKTMARDETAFAIGNDYELPVLFDQLDRGYIQEVKEDPSITPLDFNREYLSIWTGSSEDSLVQLKDLEDSRILKRPELSDERKSNDKNTRYIISIDVARSEKDGTATTAMVVIKAKERTDGTFTKELVNIKTYKGLMHFKYQAKAIKDMVELYNASMVVIDANGAGTGLVDILIMEDERYPAYSVVNDKNYDKYKTAGSLPLIFNFQSNAKNTNASDVYNYFMSTIAKKELKLLISDKEMKDNLSGRNVEEDFARLAPAHIETSRFVDEVMNLKYQASGHRTTIKKISSQMDKDRFSAVSYGIYYIYTLEKENLAKRNKTRITSPKGYFRKKKANFRVFS